MKRLGALMRPGEVRSVVSIAMALESTSRGAQQDDLFGGPLVLEPTLFGDYYAKLAQAVCSAAQKRQADKQVQR